MTAAAKKPRYLYNHVRPHWQDGEVVRKDYVRAWNEGRGRNAVTVVQVWLGKEQPEGEPDGDWAMPRTLGVDVSVAQAVVQTTPRRSA